MLNEVGVTSCGDEEWVVVVMMVMVVVMMMVLAVIRSRRLGDRHFLGIPEEDLVIQALENNAGAEEGKVGREGDGEATSDR